MAMTPEEEKYLADYRELTLKVSVKNDELTAENKTLKERLAAPPAGTQPPKAAAPVAAPAPPPTPPAPTLPPPARPVSVPAFYALPAAERERVAEFYGGSEKLTAELDAQFHNRLRIRGASSASVSGLIAPPLGGHPGPDPTAVYAAYVATEPRPQRFPDAPAPRAGDGRFTPKPLPHFPR